MKNIIKDVKYFLKYIDVNCHLEWLTDKVNSSTYIPIYSSISQIFDELNIKNIVININLEQLTQVPLPAMAVMKDQRFVVLHKIERDMVTFSSTDKGGKSLSLIEFSSKWSGVVIIANAHKTSGQNNYSNYKKTYNQNIFYNSITKLSDVIFSQE